MRWRLVLLHVAGAGAAFAWARPAHACEDRVDFLRGPAGAIAYIRGVKDEAQANDTTSSWCPVGSLIALNGAEQAVFAINDRASTPGRSFYVLQVFRRYRDRDRQTLFTNLRGTWMHSGCGLRLQAGDRRRLRQHPNAVSTLLSTLSGMQSQPPTTTQDCDGISYWFSNAYGDPNLSLVAGSHLFMPPPGMRTDSESRWWSIQLIAVSYLTGERPITRMPPLFSVDRAGAEQVLVRVVNQDTMSIRSSLFKLR